jgi:hypothetical protein
MFARRIFLMGALASFVMPAAILAADPKPDATIKNRNIEASVFLDDKIKAGGRGLAQTRPADVP